MFKIMARLSLPLSMLLAGLLAASFSSATHAQGMTVNGQKSLCAGQVTALAGCTQIPGSGVPVQITPGAIVTYVVELTSATATGSVSLQESLPAGFTLAGSTPAGTCNVIAGSSTGATFTLVSNALTGSAALTGLSLQPGQTVDCFFSGYFNNPGANVTNKVTVTSDGAAISPELDHSATVSTGKQLPSDLSITKTVDPANASNGIDVTNGPVTLTYTIVVKNNGPEPVYLGSMFRLYDTLSFPPSGVPMQVQLPNASTCTAAPGTTSCVDPIGPTSWQPTTSATSVGLGPWHFPTTGPNSAGFMPVGGTMTISYQVEVRRNPLLLCALGGEKVHNEAHFDLNGIAGTAMTEVGPTNNTATGPDVPVHTGMPNDPDCALTSDGPIRITKTQVLPTGGQIAWANTGADVEYEITLKNVGTVPIAGVRLRDRVMLWPGTPHFSATVVNWQCAPAIACTPPPPPPVTTPPLVNLGGMFATATVWNKNAVITLQPNQPVVLTIKLHYQATSCDSFGNGNNGGNIIRNIGRIDYTFNSAQVHTESFVDTVMGPVTPCNFQVSKTVTEAGTDNIDFPGSLTYTVTFKNAGATPAPVGTLIDSLRLVQPNYATSLPLTYEYTCHSSGSVLGALLINGTATPIPTSGGPIHQPTASGSAVYTTLPTQGARIIQNAGQIKFDSGAVLSCTVTIHVQRPAPNDRFCLASGEPRLENMALMDVADFYDPNTQWPPSGTYSAGIAAGVSQPTPATTNWSSVSVKLPKCYKLTINKTVQPTMTWSPGGPTPHQYTITVTNSAPPSTPPNTLTGSMSGNTWTGPEIGDVFAQLGITPTGLTATSSCATLTGGSSGTPFQITNFPAACTIVIKFNVNGPYQPDPHTQNLACNRAFVAMVPSNSPNWYANDPADVQDQQACVLVLGTGTLSVQKLIDNQAGVQFPPGIQFPMMVSCTRPDGSISGGMGYAGLTAAQVLGPQPVGTNCSVNEITSLISPPPNNGRCKLPDVAQWQSPVVYAPSQQVSIAAAGTNYSVTMKNTVVCVTPPVNKLVVSKVFEPSTLAVAAGATFPINVDCSPWPHNQLVTLTAPSALSDVVSIPVGASCHISELPPQNTNIPAGCKWITNYPDHQDITIGSGDPATFTIRNSLSCKPDLAVVKTGPVPMPDHSGFWSFTITVSSPGGPFSVPNGALTMTEMPFPQMGGSFVGMIVSSGPWTCVGWNCTYHGPGPASIGDVLGTFTVYYWGATPVPYVNCASIALGGGLPETDLANNLSCRSGGGSVPQVDLAIKKAGPFPVAGSPGHVTFTLTVSNSGPAFTLPAGGGITVTDLAAALPGVFTGISASPSAMWNCPGVAGATASCTYTGNSTIAANAPLGVITITVAQSVPLPQYTNCATVRFNYGTPLLDISPINNTSCVKVSNAKILPVTTAPPTSIKCQPPMVVNAAGDACGCPSGTALRGRECVTAVVCTPPMVANAAGVCGCPDGSVLKGRECVKPVACAPPMTANAAGVCSCPSGTELKGRDCVKVVVCTPPMTANAAGVCSCPSGTEPKGRDCVKVVVCTPPMTANAAGVCSCPSGTESKGRDCVKPDRPDPRERGVDRGNPRDQRR